SHMRFAMKCIGKTIYSFNSTKELVQAIHDAIKGHQLALQARILHRDVSMGNVLIVDESQKKKYGGLLTDFDYSFMFPATAGAAQGKNRTSPSSLYCRFLKTVQGTPYFIAIEILRKARGVQHGAHHDLESFYWVLVWSILRHTDHTHPDKNRAYGQLFFRGTDSACVAIKREWIQINAYELTIRGNAPLTELLHEWTARCDDQNVPERYQSVKERVHLTHDMVLGILKKALQQKGWPEGDA
ncbi:hypothetical protein OBBRIDRAFT_689425, partial [Obba rivulosa]